MASKRGRKQILKFMRTIIADKADAIMLQTAEQGNSFPKAIGIENMLFQIRYLRSIEKSKKQSIGMFFVG